MKSDRGLLVVDIEPNSQCVHSHVHTTFYDVLL